MNNLYFKDANGDFHPIDVSHLELRPNSLVFLQFKDKDYHPTPGDLEAILQIVEAATEDKECAKGVEFIIMARGINIEVLERDKDFMNKEILIDISEIEGKDNQDYIKSLLGDTLKRFHHEFVRLPIKIEGGNA